MVSQLLFGAQQIGHCGTGKHRLPEMTAKGKERVENDATSFA